MTPDVISAFLLLQERSARQAHSAYWAERIDLALDDLTRNPHRTGAPEHLVRNALSEAGKLMRRRQDLAHRELRVLAPAARRLGAGAPEVLEVPCPASSAAIEDVEARLDVAARLRSMRLLPSDRRILKMLMEGATGEQIAEALRVRPATARVRIYNARQRAEVLWKQGGYPQAGPTQGFRSGRQWTPE
jgi:DNA-binding NarL/FixJ family response regulator